MTRVRAWCAIAGGLVVAAVGGGIGVPHLRDDGVTIESALGLLLLGAGLVLAAFGTVTVVRLAAGIRRVGAVLLVAFVAYMVVPTVAVAVAATHPPRPALGDVTPADVGLDATDVTFTSADGVDLAGWWSPSRNGDSVVLLHGSGATRTAMVEEAAALSALGYGVLVYDARGHGESAGQGMELGWSGTDDLSGAVAFVRSRPDAAAGRVFAVGVDIGGEAAVGALASEPGLCAAVAEGVLGHTAADTAWRSDASFLPGTLLELRDRMTFALTDLLDGRPPASLRRAIDGSAPRRVLLIAAGREPDEEVAAVHVAAAAPKRVEVWVAPGAGHGGVFDARRAEWIRRVGEFLAAAPC